jgi:hypothetical protein
MDVDMWSVYTDGRSDRFGCKEDLVIRGNLLRPLNNGSCSHEKFVASAE